MSNIKSIMCLCLAALLLAVLSVSVYAAGELKAYVQKQDDSYEYSLSKIQLYNNRQVSVTTFDMTSQKWQGEEWKHKVQIYYPSQCTMKSTALLLVTGGSPSTDKTATLVQACFALSAPVAVLYDIPNQPLFDKKEDALIAYTFEKPESRCGIAFDKQRSLQRDGHIPSHIAHMGFHECGTAAHLLCFIKEGDLEAVENGMG